MDNPRVLDDAVTMDESLEQQVGRLLRERSVDDPCSLGVSKRPLQIWTDRRRLRREVTRGVP